MTQYIGEIRMFGGNFAPSGWALCNGQIISISENETLYALIGTTYGGDGVQTFALPNLQSRVPVHQGTLGTGETFVMGQLAGQETVTLLSNQIPIHSHPLIATSTAASSTSPANAVPAMAAGFNPYIPANANAAMAAQSISYVGGSQPHDNIQPILTVNFIIALYGVFPSRN